MYFHAFPLHNWNINIHSEVEGDGPNYVIIWQMTLLWKWNLQNVIPKNDLSIISKLINCNKDRYKSKEVRFQNPWIQITTMNS